MSAQPLPARIDNLFLPEELEQNDLSASRAVANWIETFVTRPHKDLGRAGAVCPFLPRAIERHTLWFAPERIANRSVTDVVQLLIGYRDRLLRAQPVEGADASYKAIVIVIDDLPADRAADYFGTPEIQNLKRPSYAEHGVVIGEFYDRNEGSAIRNQDFHPFRAPVPFLLLRPAVVSDWMFFLDNEDWLGVWARRFGESAVPALAERLRRTNWRSIGL